MSEAALRSSTEGRTEELTSPLTGPPRSSTGRGLVRSQLFLCESQTLRHVINLLRAPRAVQRQPAHALGAGSPVLRRPHSKVMELQYWSLAVLLSLMPYGCPMEVHILTPEPAYIIPGKPLLLQARIDLGPQEEVSMVTWEREPEAGPVTRVTLATCAGKPLACAGSSPDGRVSVEQQGAMLQLKGYTPRDGGVYLLAVTDQHGARTTAHCIVREYEEVNHVSVSINVSHSSLVCGEAWGTEPVFTWLYEQQLVSEAVGQVSRDGQTLLITRTPICGSFTCKVSNKRGYSSASYTSGPCPGGGAGPAVWAVILVLLLLLGGAAALLLLWRRQRQHQSRGERLQEHFDENI